MPKISQLPLTERKGVQERIPIPSTTQIGSGFDAPVLPMAPYEPAISNAIASNKITHEFANMLDAVGKAAMYKAEVDKQKDKLDLESDWDEFDRIHSGKFKTAIGSENQFQILDDYKKGLVGFDKMVKEGGWTTLKDMAWANKRMAQSQGQLGEFQVLHTKTKQGETVSRLELKTARGLKDAGSKINIDAIRVLDDNIEAFEEMARLGHLTKEQLFEKTKLYSQTFAQNRAELIAMQSAKHFATNPSDMPDAAGRLLLLQNRLNLPLHTLDLPALHHKFQETFQSELKLQNAILKSKEQTDEANYGPERDRLITDFQIKIDGGTATNEDYTNVLEDMKDDPDRLLKVKLLWTQAYDTPETDVVNYWTTGAGRAVIDAELYDGKQHNINEISVHLETLDNSHHMSTKNPATISSISNFFRGTNRNWKKTQSEVSTVHAITSEFVRGLDSNTMMALGEFFGIDNSMLLQTKAMHDIPKWERLLWESAGGSYKIVVDMVRDRIRKHAAEKTFPFDDKTVDSEEYPHEYRQYVKDQFKDVLTNYRTELHPNGFAFTSERPKQPRSTSVGEAKEKVEIGEEIGKRAFDSGVPDLAVPSLLKEGKIITEVSANLAEHRKELKRLQNLELTKISDKPTTLKKGEEKEGDSDAEFNTTINWGGGDVETLGKSDDTSVVMDKLRHFMPEGERSKNIENVLLNPAVKRRTSINKFVGDWAKWWWNDFQQLGTKAKTGIGEAVYEAAEGSAQFNRNFYEDIIKDPAVRFGRYYMDTVLVPMFSGATEERGWGDVFYGKSQRFGLPWYHKGSDLMEDIYIPKTEGQLQDMLERKDIPPSDLKQTVGDPRRKEWIEVEPPREFTEISTGFPSGILRGFSPPTEKVMEFDVGRLDDKSPLLAITKKDIDNEITSYRKAYGDDPVELRKVLQEAKDDYLKYWSTRSFGGKAPSRLHKDKENLILGALDEALALDDATLGLPDDKMRAGMILKETEDQLLREMKEAADSLSPDLMALTMDDISEKPPESVIRKDDRDVLTQVTDAIAPILQQLFPEESIYQRPSSLGDTPIIEPKQAETIEPAFIEAMNKLKPDYVPPITPTIKRPETKVTHPAAQDTFVKDVEEHTGQLGEKGIDLASQVWVRGYNTRLDKTASKEDKTNQFKKELNRYYNKQLKPKERANLDDFMATFEASTPAWLDDLTLTGMTLSEFRQLMIGTYGAESTWGTKLLSATDVSGHMQTTGITRRTVLGFKHTFGTDMASYAAMKAEDRGEKYYDLEQLRYEANYKNGKLLRERVKKDKTLDYLLGIAIMIEKMRYPDEYKFKDVMDNYRASPLDVRTK